LNSEKIWKNRKKLWNDMKNREEKQIEYLKDMADAEEK
jgi:hypothetical protein